MAESPPKKDHVDAATVNRMGRTCLCFNLRKAARTITQIYDQALKPSGLRVTQFSILAAVKAFEPATIKRLARTLAADRTTLTRNLKPLEKKGLISIGPGEDQRERLVRLTDDGQEALDRAYPFWEAAQKRLGGELGPARFEQAVAGLQDLSTVKDES